MRRRGSAAMDRFTMRPSIARMTLDLDYGDMGMDDGNNDSRHGGPHRTEALQHRLAELLVFEIRQDGETDFKSLSVRGLYKYVMKSIKISAEKRQAIKNTETNAIRHIQKRHEQKKSKRRRRQSKRYVVDNIEDTLGGGSYSSSSSSSSSSQSEHEEGKDSEEKEQLNPKKSTSHQSLNTLGSTEEKTVSFGGSEGPVVTEHPPKIPGVPIAQEEEFRQSMMKGEHTISAVRTKEQPEDPNNADDQSSLYLAEEEVVTYRERLGGFLHPRDMRRLVTPFSASNEPELIVRRHVMLLNFDPLRAVILRDRLLVLVPDGADSLLVELERRVRGGYREVERAIFGESAATSGESFNMNDSQHSASNLSHASGKSGGGGGGGNKQKISGSTIIQKVKDTFHNDHKNAFAEKKHSFASSDNDSATNTATDILSEYQEWDEMESRDWIDLPFELQCLDAVLGHVSAILGKDASELQSNSIKAMDNLLNNGTGRGEEILRHMKNSIKEMTSRVKGFIRAMNLVLDETEDMALMNLTRLLTHPERFIQPVPDEILNEESDEPELILEAHLQTAFSLTNSLDLVRGEILTTQELINQRLDAVRNRLLLANMIISVGSLCIGTGSFIGSIFGMNVTNGIENDPVAFKQIVIGTCVGMLGIVLLFGLVLWYAGTLPNLRSSF